MLGLVGLVPLAPIVWSADCFAQRFLSVEEAQRIAFPQATKFVEEELVLDESMRERIEAMSDVRVKGEKLKTWRVYRGESFLGRVVFDQVIGKHLLIDYVVALTPERTVKQIEILEYRENYGAEIREDSWRGMFVGKSAKDELRLRKDIPNISGATYSTMHVTEGVRRILATVEIVEGEQGA